MPVPASETAMTSRAKSQNRVAHRPIGGGDVTSGSVIIDAEVHAITATLRCFDERRQCELTMTADDGLRCFEHQLQTEGVEGQLIFSFQQLHQLHCRRDLLRNLHLGNGDDEILRQFATRFPRAAW